MELEFCDDGASVNITAESIPGAHYTWFNNGNTSSETHNESIGLFSEVIRESGKFRLLIESHGCVFQSAEMIATKTPRDSVFVPNVITPNGDKTNEDFEIYTNGVDEYSLHVINRYGKEVWSGRNGSKSWNAANDSPGVYFWVLSYSSKCSDRKEQKGWVQVLK